MYYSNMNSVDISKCILCHDAVCTKSCPAMDPARIIRALRFDNAAGASMMCPKKMYVCIVMANVKMSVLRKFPFKN